MADSSAKLVLRRVRCLQSGQAAWDGAVAGFGARRQNGTVISYIVVYRTKEGRQRTFTIGKHGSPWMPDMARQEARRVLAEVAKGDDPAADKIVGRSAITVAVLCQQYLADVEAGRVLTRRKLPKKESTLISDRGRISRHIVLLLGRRLVSAITRNDVEGFMHDVAVGRTAGMQKTKPRGLSVADRRRERRLTDDEYRQLGKALANAGNVWNTAVDATRLMMLAGWRRGEVLGLRWQEVDLPRRTARLADTKTGT